MQVIKIQDYISNQIMILIFYSIFYFTIASLLKFSKIIKNLFIYLFKIINYANIVIIKNMPIIWINLLKKLKK